MATSTYFSFYAIELASLSVFDKQSIDCGHFRDFNQLYLRFLHIKTNNILIKQCSWDRTDQLGENLVAPFKRYSINPMKYDQGQDELTNYPLLKKLSLSIYTLKHLSRGTVAESR